MRFCLLRLCPLLLLFALNGPALAWNAAGHRLIAVVAWQQLPPATRDAVSRTLAAHPEHGRWREKAGSDTPALVFAEAATWADEIRGDPRYVDETRSAPTAGPGGLPDNARHKRWHYVDLDARSAVVAGELDVQIPALAARLRTTRSPVERAWALAWLTHLVGDIHQPLHVGRAGDDGGNAVEIENVATARPTFGNLHSYWDDLPGTSRLRGRRLEQAAAALLAGQPAVAQGDVDVWRAESHALLAEAYPTTNGSLLPLITPEFDMRARQIAEQRLAAAGCRLAGLLETALTPVSRETGMAR